MSQSTDTFAGLPAASLTQLSLAALGEVRIALLGAAEASPYKPGTQSHSANAPAALRAAAKSFARQTGQYDFDLEDALVGAEGQTYGMADCGDIATDAGDPAGNQTRIMAAVRAVLDAGAVPVVLGGDDSVPIPVFRAFAGRGPFTVVQIDAHADWGDVIQGNPDGYGSTMRRAAELPHVTGMVQVGLRGLGSGGAWQIEDARAWGSHLVTMRDISRYGMDAALHFLPEGGDVLVTIDCDGLDPAVLPAVNMPTPGGLNYQHVMDLLRGVAARGRIAGFCLVEFVPERDDAHRLCALTAARIVAVALGLIRRSQEQMAQIRR